MTEKEYMAVAEREYLIEPYIGTMRFVTVDNKKSTVMIKNLRRIGYPINIDYGLRFDVWGGDFESLTDLFFKHDPINCDIEFSDGGHRIWHISDAMLTVIDPVLISSDPIVGNEYMEITMRVRHEDISIELLGE